MTDREEQNIDAEEEEPKNNSEIELSNQESSQKHRNYDVIVPPFTSPRKEKLRIAAYELYNLEKQMTKTIFRTWNPSYLKGREDKEKEKKMKEGRIVIKDDGHESTQENTVITTTTSSSRKGKEIIDSVDHMSKIRKLIVRFMLYIDKIEDMATHRQKSEDDWIRYFEAGIVEFQNINGILIYLMTDKISRRRDEEGEEYIKVHEIMSKLEEINAFLDGSQHIGIVTEKDLNGLELQVCELQLKRCNNQLEELDRTICLREKFFASSSSFVQ